MKAKPQIELYLYSTNQEFASKKGHHTFLKRHSEPYYIEDKGMMLKEQIEFQELQDKASGCPGFWQKNNWRLNFNKVILPKSKGTGENLLQFLITRTEDFGGIALDPSFDRVYKLNTAGYELLQLLIEVAREDKLSKFKAPKKFMAADVENFISFLKGAGLWIA